MEAQLSCSKVWEIFLENLSLCSDYQLRARFCNAVGWSQDQMVVVSCGHSWMGCEQSAVGELAKGLPN